MSYKVLFSSKAIAAIPKLKAAHLDKKTQDIIALIKENPFASPPVYEKLVGNLAGLYSRRINLQHRLVYEVKENTKTIYILTMWSHYE